MKHWIEIMDICFMTTIEIIVAIIITMILDGIANDSPEKDKPKSTLRLILETCFYACILWIMIFLCGKVIKKIPFPLNGWYGYKHSIQEEVKLLTVLTTVTIIFCQTIHYKIEEIRHRI